MKPQDWRKIMRTMGLLTQLGIVIIVNIGVGFYLGLKLDQWLGYTYLFKILGIIIGIGSGFYSDYKLILSSMEDDEDDEQD
ncbi:MAG TPA: AtpZ/AtpI family protein [Halanaerobiales bacterium]|nr:AtpZ/AtpI family protein [Halanaerobiales bacterium]